MAIIAEVKTLLGVDVPTVVLFKDPVVSAIAEADTLMQGGGSDGPAIAPRVPLHRGHQGCLFRWLAGTRPACWVAPRRRVAACPAELPDGFILHGSLTVTMALNSSVIGSKLRCGRCARHEALRATSFSPLSPAATELQFKVAPLRTSCCRLSSDLLPRMLGDGSEEKEAQAVKIAEDLYAFDGCFEPFDPFMQRSSNGLGPREEGSAIYFTAARD